MGTPYLLVKSKHLETMMHKYINNPVSNHFKDKCQPLASICVDNIRRNAKGNLCIPNASINFEKASLIRESIIYFVTHSMLVLLHWQ